MPKVTVTEKALRELVREAMFNPGFAGWSSNEDGPASVNPNTDPSIAVTDPINPNFTPQTKTEFGVAVNQLVKNLPDNQMPELYDTVKTAIDQKEEKEDEDEMDKKARAGGTGVEGPETPAISKAEEAVRRGIRNILAGINPRWSSPRIAEAAPKNFGPVTGPLPPVKKIPAGEHGGEYNRKKEKYHNDLKKILGKVDPDAVEKEPDIDPEDPEVAPESGEGEIAAAPSSADLATSEPKKAKKGTALGGMTDVSGATFEDIAKDLGFSVAGAKQAVDKALEKAQFLAQDMDDDDREILVLTSMNDYIKYLNKSGELTAADIQLMKDHPDVVRELDGFREFLHNAIRRQRKSDQELDNPLSDDSDRITIKSPDEGGVDAEEAEEESPTTLRGLGGQRPGDPTPVPPEPGAAKKAKDNYKVYPFKGKRSVVRVGGKLYGTGENGSLADGGNTQFKGGERANIAKDGDKLTVSKPDSDHSQSWDPVEEASRPTLRLVETKEQFARGDRYVLPGTPMIVVITDVMQGIVHYKWVVLKSGAKAEEKHKGRGSAGQVTAFFKKIGLVKAQGPSDTGAVH